MKNPKKKQMWRQYISVAFFMLIGCVCGVLFATHLLQKDVSIGTLLASYVLLMAGMYLALFLQIAIHEAGHLIFGLLTGYRYSSFRIGGFMWLKKDGRVRFKRLSIAGTGGQCLMIPPDMVDGRVPFVLYNLGGVVLNVIAALLFFGLYLLCQDTPFVGIWLLITAIIGFVFALMNGLPLRLGLTNNDGHNAVSLGKNRNALRAFWLQMKINELSSNGIRLKDMPEKWFADVPSPEEMQNSIIAAIGVCICSRLMDRHEFAAVNQLMQTLLSMDTAILGLHRSLLICDRIFCELMAENRPDLLDELLDKQQKRFMRSMKRFPSVVRTEYAYALLAQHDVKKADEIEKLFEKIARTYPYPSEIEGERELLHLARQAQQAKPQDAALIGCRAGGGV
jgi:hypothetical protein